MPTKKDATKKTTRKENTKKEVSKLKVAQPTKFILHIAKCGTDTFTPKYKQIEHDNPILLGLNGVKIICDGMAPKNAQPFYQYLLACAILKGLTFDPVRLQDDIVNIAERIKSLSLKSLKGGSNNERP
ncbi:hypothetical protein KAR91_03370 [Candidatus Pacearchaeota archaeon]|nr:hypothetical protein [Candidatus Pacearchaeota archaeon]